MESGDPGAGALRRWAALVVPGLAAGLSWPATEGMAWLDRVAIGVAAAVALYAVVHLVASGPRRRGDR